MMSDIQIKTQHHQLVRNDLENENVSLLTSHEKFIKKSRKSTKRQYLADVVSLNANRVILKANINIVKPRLPSSIVVSDFKSEQVPYIEQLGWVLVYLFKRYPELKQTKGFNSEHINCEEHILRKGFYETHVFSRIDVGCASPQQKHMTIEIAHGKFDEKNTRWSVEVLADGGLVRKYICETQDQVVSKVDQQLHKYGLTKLAWEQARNVS
ncbi:hypothetical protein [Alkalimarinus alittae]|uniref:Uncharacterized protein n=1 Tax=Alkalimarinus alittae TaxID=2961619 RepID=A0ABY6N313_9ALTE|nr:hypothetical protein [Alkalimarinus alittae]UZE96382.1 hypothetical protein NKI27_01150 [Alkalimarinus alittae]